MGKAIFYERGVKMLVRVGGTTLQSQIFGAREKIFVRPQKAQQFQYTRKTAIGDVCEATGSQIPLFSVFGPL